MPKYGDAYRKRVNGTTYYIVAKTGILFQRVLIRDGKYSAIDDTLEASCRLSFRAPDLEEQVAKTLNRQVQKEERRKDKENHVQKKINRACKRIDEVYDDDW